MKVESYKWKVVIAAKSFLLKELNSGEQEIILLPVFEQEHGTSLHNLNKHKSKS